MRATWALLLGLVCGCDGASGPQVQHPAFNAVTPPAVNRPRVPRPAPVGPEAQPTLPAGELPAFLVLRGGRTFEGEATIAGRLSLLPGRVVVTPAEGDPLTILYRLPAGVPAPTLAPDTARVHVRIARGPDGRDALVLVGHRAGVVFAMIRRSSTAPIRVDLDDGSSLVQQLTREKRPGYWNVDLRVARDHALGAPPIPIGVPVPLPGVDTSRIYVEVSHLFVSSPGEAHGGRRYLLWAWISGQK